MTEQLRDKFFGCILGVHVGSAMGAPVEGWPYQRIQDTHGTLTELLPYEHYGNGWVREPGTTEDGVERQKLMITAIVEKQDRVNAEDVRAIWVRDVKDGAAGTVSEPFEGTLMAMARSGIPARDLGRYCDYAGLNSFARACHPMGLINAGDVNGAFDDIMEVGQLYQTSNSRGLHWAAVTGTAIAAATRPDATVDSVLGAVFDRCHPDMVVAELERELKRTKHCGDFRDLRVAFDAVYNGAGMPYPFSYANEVVTKAICIFRMVQGDLTKAMIAGVNMGRDTDCITAVAAGIAGSLSGSTGFPDEYITQVDRATSLNPYTNTQRTLRETSDGLYGAYQGRMRRLRRWMAEMEDGQTR